MYRCRSMHGNTPRLTAPPLTEPLCLKDTAPPLKGSFGGELPKHFL